jgi:hypothetical protein
MCVDDTLVTHIRLNPGELETGTSSEGFESNSQTYVGQIIFSSVQC